MKRRFIKPTIIKHDKLHYMIFNRGHYVGTWTTPAAQKCGKPLWASESGNGQSTVLGAGCVARVGINDFIKLGFFAINSKNQK